MTVKPDTCNCGLALSRLNKPRKAAGPDRQAIIIVRIAADGQVDK